uniref:Uncharacterized protein n=1 Tax=Physcomitrium patens TaxID=3218 RepID=A0A7I3YW86_PHYPA
MLLLVDKLWTTRALFYLLFRIRTHAENFGSILYTNQAAHQYFRMGLLIETTHNYLHDEFLAMHRSLHSVYVVEKTGSAWTHWLAGADH